MLRRNNEGLLDATSRSHSRRFDQGRNDLPDRRLRIDMTDNQFLALETRRRVEECLVYAPIYNDRPWEQLGFRRLDSRYQYMLFLVRHEQLSLA